MLCRMMLKQKIQKSISSLHKFITIKLRKSLLFILSILVKNGHVVLDYPCYQNSQKSNKSESIAFNLQRKKAPKKGHLT
jgi:hypothetical protein